MAGANTALAAITLTAGEISTAAAGGEDVVGMLASAKIAVSEAQGTINSIISKIPAGANATALAAAVTSFLT